MDSSKQFEFVSYEYNAGSKEVIFRYKIKLNEKELSFEEKLSLPELSVANVPPELLDSILHSLHLMLGISYWKLYCPEKIIISTRELSKEQATFWNTVYTKGLGEFFFKNKIDFRGLINFPYSESVTQKPVSFPRTNKSLVGIGGGKDSLVSAELLKTNNKEFASFNVETQRSNAMVSKIITLIGKDQVVLRRILDTQLFELNKSAEVYNGHIPVSAINAFIGILAGILYDFTYVVVSNEKTASYGNTEYLGETINHQWSKSLEFEKLFQTYIKSFVTPDVIYFSLLRPLSEIQITEMFSKYPQYFQYFSSCNRAYTLQSDHENAQWCGECPKCAFVFLMLAVSMNKDQLLQIFGQNLLDKESLAHLYRELLGVTGIKPFECVGTPEEVKLAFYKLYKKGEYNDTSIMKMFENEVLPGMSNVEELEENVYQKGEDVIPEEFRNISLN